MSRESGKVEEKAFNFAKNIVLFVTLLPGDEVRYTIGKQLLRSGTAIGANIEEAKGGISRPDFIHCMNIAKKEARETLYWLRLLSEFLISKKEKVQQLVSECNELVKMLTAIVKTSQGK